MTTQPLYLPEDKVAELVLGKKRAGDWPLIAKVLEREAGLPPINPVIGMRHWPAVVAWFAKYEKVEGTNPGRHSGKELPCTPGRKRRASSGGKTQMAQVVSIGRRVTISEKPDTTPPKSA